MKLLLITVLAIFCDFFSVAQISTFNQYNNSFALINPAFIADVDKNQVSLISRSQWPDNYLGGKSGQFSLNRFFSKINSSIGFSSNYGVNNTKFYESFSNGIQYGYRVLFLEKYFICLGSGISYEKIMIDVNNYHPYYFPKIQFTPKFSSVQSVNKIKGNIGIVFNTADQINKQYVGLSIKNISLDFIDYNSQIDQAYTFSIQGMKSFVVSRNSVLLNFINFERIGRLSYERLDLQKAYSYIFVQSNYFFNRAGIDRNWVQILL